MMCTLILHLHCDCNMFLWYFGLNCRCFVSRYWFVSLVILFWMGHDSFWKNSGLNCGSNLWPPDHHGWRSTKSMVFPTNTNPFDFAFPKNAALPNPGFAEHRFLQMNSVSIPLNQSSFATAAATQKRFLVFDKSWDQTNIVFSSVGSPFAYPSPINPSAELPWSDGTNVSNGLGGEEMHEDTEEIDALLYSDSEDYREEEEASTGHSPLETMTVGSTEEVASSSAAPAKRRRVDTSLTDTASSAGSYYCVSHENHGHAEDDAESSWVGGGEQCGAEPGEEQDSPSAAASCGSKRLRRERIQETVGMLRRIIPGGRGNGKDATAVLDEAIRYLRSLKLKAQAMGAAATIV